MMFIEQHAIFKRQFKHTPKKKNKNIKFSHYVLIWMFHHLQGIFTKTALQNASEPLMYA